MRRAACRAAILFFAIVSYEACAPRRNENTVGGAAKDHQSRDTFVRAMLGDASYLNPLLASDSASGDVNSLVFNGLVKYDRDLNIVGELAESWRISDGGRTIKFRLKKNVLWHDGKPFTSADVKFTYEKLIDPKTKTPYASDYLLVESLSTPDPSSVVVRYKKPFAPALESWGMGIIPKHVFEGKDINTHPANRSPIGTGPFKFSGWKSDERITLEAFDDCFEGAPGIGRIVFRVVPDQSVQFLELRNDSLDFMSLTPDQHNAYDVFFRRHDKFRYAAFQYAYLGFNLKRRPFDDPRVRRAIAHAIDKSQIIDGVLLGIGRAATGPFPPQSWAHNPDVKDFEYDPAKARAMLESAGWRDSDKDGVLDNIVVENGVRRKQNFEFTVMTNQGNKIRAMAAEIIQSELAAVGIKMNIRIVEWSTFIHQFINKKNFDAVILAWNLGRDPDQYSIWHSAESQEGKYNFVSYNNPEADALIERGRGTFDAVERRRIYRRMHKIIHDDAAYIFLYYPDSLPVVHKRFVGPEVAPAGLGWNFRQWRAAPGKIKYAS
ncbi:MAG: peptide-binding protein [Endomicrobiia bacterium]|nr:peptide-binding protein [Endomicrobiia bacterium]